MILDNLGTKIADGTLGMQIFASGLMPQLTLLIAGLVLVLMVAFDARGRYRTICKLGSWPWSPAVSARSPAFMPAWFVIHPQSPCPLA
jgi:hypothetical protein